MASWVPLWWGRWPAAPALAHRRCCPDTIEGLLGIPVFGHCVPGLFATAVHELLTGGDRGLEALLVPVLVSIAFRSRCWSLPSAPNSFAAGAKALLNLVLDGNLV